MNFFLLLLGFIFAPFAAIQLVTGKRTLAFVALATFGLIGYGYFTIPEPEDAGGVMASAFISLAALSAIAGIIIKAATLYGQSKGYTLKRLWALRGVAIGVFLLVVFYPVIYMLWDKRAPPSWCNHERIIFSVAEEKFVAPGIYGVTAHLDNGHNKKGDLNGFFTFGGPKPLRNFCWSFNNGQTPAAVNALTLRLEAIPNNRTITNSEYIEKCKKAEWPEEICEPKNGSTPLGYPQEIKIYNSSTYNNNWEYQYIKSKIAKADKATDIPGSLFDGTNYYWIKPEGKEYTENSSILECHKHQKDYFDCQADEEWKGNIRVTYSGRVKPDAPFVNAQALRTKTWEFLNSISIKE